MVHLACIGAIGRRRRLVTLFRLNLASAGVLTPGTYFAPSVRCMPGLLRSHEGLLISLYSSGNGQPSSLESLRFGDLGQPSRNLQRQCYDEPLAAMHDGPAPNAKVE